MRYKILTIVLVALIGAPCIYASLIVPSQYPTLQAAVDASADGDTILIESGSYSGAGFAAIVLDATCITIGPSSGFRNVLIDLAGGSFIIASDTLKTGLSDITLTGLVLTNGATAVTYGESCYMTILNCQFSQCSVGILDTLEENNGTISNNHFLDNNVGIHLVREAAYTISSNIFEGNGAGILSAGIYQTEIVDNIFVGHSIALSLYAADSIRVSGNVLLGNETAIEDDNLSTRVTFECNDLYSNQSDFYNFSWGVLDQNGNINYDPLICDTTFQYPLVMSTSPLLPGNNSCGVTIGNVSVGCICADIDNSGSSPDISDLTYLVDYMFSGGTPPVFTNTANLDGLDGVNISDLTFFVDYLFGGGDPPGC